LLSVSALTVAVMLVIGHTRAAGWIATILYALQGGLLLSMGEIAYTPGVIEASLRFSVLGQPMAWEFTTLSWFFALITLGAALAAAWYAAGEWGERYQASGGSLRLLHVALALNVVTMLVLLASADLLSLFIGWELVSWASFLMMALAGGVAVGYALRYITYAMGGAMAVMMGLALVYSQAGSLQMPAILSALPEMSTAAVWAMLGLFGAGFGVKMGLLPFHLWQANAYAETPGPGAAFLGAISSRMGLFAIIVVLVQLLGIARIADLEIPYTFMDARDLIAWIAVFTIILPTYTALRQTDARKLLAWHGIGQGGYMLLGIMVGDALGSAGGLLHIFNYATNQLILLLAVFAVIHRTGTADLDRLGGLVTRMPLSFLVMLIGIIGLAGLPPMNGFVSKWMIYKSLIDDGRPLLFVASVIGTLGTVLSVYKLIHNMFLGQLRVEHEKIREAPWSMTLPMLLVAAVVFFSGYFPGLVLDWVATVQSSVGLPVLPHTLGGVPLANGGLDMVWIVSIMLASFGIAAVIFYLLGGRATRVHQLDNYAGGHFLTAETRYQYSHIFYPGLFRLIDPLYRGSFRWLEGALVSASELASMGAQGVLRVRHPGIYLLVVSVLVLAWIL
jgi:NADH-quinone oxidoreductase subunit M